MDINPTDINGGNLKASNDGYCSYIDVNKSKFKHGCYDPMGEYCEMSLRATSSDVALNIDKDKGCLGLYVNMSPIPTKAQILNMKRCHTKADSQ